MGPDAFRTRIDQIYTDLDQYSYYALLNLQTDAMPDDIRRAYHRMAVNLHPDRFHADPDVVLKKKVYAIYKRIAEAYRILMDHRLRVEYDGELSKGVNRLVKTERPSDAPKRQETAIENVQARKFFLLGQDAERRGDIKGAKLNYKFALDMEQGHPLIQERLAALDDKQ